LAALNLIRFKLLFFKVIVDSKLDIWFINNINENNKITLECTKKKILLIIIKIVYSSNRYIILTNVLYSLLIGFCHNGLK